MPGFIIDYTAGVWPQQMKLTLREQLFTHRGFPECPCCLECNIYSGLCHDYGLMIFDIFFTGSKVGMLDYMFWPHMERVSVIEATLNSEIITSKVDFPKLAGWYARMLEEPAVKETFFSAADHIGFYKTARDGEPNYNYGL